MIAPPSLSVKEVFQATHLSEVEMGKGIITNWLEDHNRIKCLTIQMGGVSILIGGIILLFIPGPGIPVIFFGIVILATQFLWARRLLKKIHGKSKNLKDYLFLKFK